MRAALSALAVSIAAAADAVIAGGVLAVKTMEFVTAANLRGAPRSSPLEPEVNAEDVDFAKELIRLIGWLNSNKMREVELEVSLEEEVEAEAVAVA